MTSAEKTTKDLRFELFIFELAEEQLDAIVVVQRLVGEATKSANWANRIKILLGELHVKTSLVSNKKVAKAFRSTEQNRSGDAEYWNDSQLTWDSSMTQDSRLPNQKAWFHTVSDPKNDQSTVQTDTNFDQYPLRS